MCSFYLYSVFFWQTCKSSDSSKCIQRSWDYVVYVCVCAFSCCDQPLKHLTATFHWTNCLFLLPPFPIFPRFILISIFFFFCPSVARSSVALFIHLTLCVHVLWNVFLFLLLLVLLQRSQLFSPIHINMRAVVIKYALV